MKRIFIYIFFIVLLSACKKQNQEIPATGTLKIVHTISGGPAVRISNFTNNVSLNSSTSNFSLYAGHPDIYVWPIGDSLHPYYTSNKSISVDKRDMLTLFLTGVPNVSAEGILVKENFPPINDSVALIRFMNLSPNSTPVNVTLSTSIGVNEYSNMSYKQLSDFKSFPAKMANSNYTFQIRSANNPNMVLASISMTGTALASFVPRFRYVTLVFRGLIGGSPAPAITRVNHYPTSGF